MQSENNNPIPSHVLRQIQNLIDARNVASRITTRRT